MYTMASIDQSSKMQKPVALPIGLSSGVPNYKNTDKNVKYRKDRESHQ